jgi:FtsP/CotA-like multicopper oxidase with cupredoxin domain
MKMGAPGKPTPNGCTKTDMTPLSTNLHFHGLTVPPVCHQDDVLKTVVQAGDAPFEYRFQIPPEEAPGLYWYHPHVHGLTSAQVLGGASGALIVEGIERANRQLAGLPERVFIIRDQDLLNPNAKPVKTNSMPSPLVLRDAEGDILNTGTGTGKPAKDLSINFVPVSYPNYLPAVIKTKPSERQVWRVLNACRCRFLGRHTLERKWNGCRSNHLGKSHSAAARRASGIYFQGLAGRRARKSCDPQRRHGSGRRKRSHAPACEDRGGGRFSGTTFASSR